MKNLVLAFVSLLAARLLSAQSPAPAPLPVRPVPAIEHVIVMIVDGLRPDVLLLADAPALHGMARAGAYSFWARTTDVAITLPSCTSMLTGVKPAKHGVTWNGPLAADKQVYPLVPTVFAMATRAGYVTAMVAGKSKFTTLCQPGTVTHPLVPTSPKVSDEEVANLGIKLIETERPALMCLHFPDVDAAGHGKGWGSPEQLAQVATTDAQIARVFAALDRAGLRGSTLVLVSADHGGAGKSHGADDMRSRHIPWMVAGPGVKHGYDLNQDRALQVNTEDTCATVCWLLGLPQQPYFDGKPIIAAFVTTP